MATATDTKKKPAKDAKGASDGEKKGLSKVVLIAIVVVVMAALGGGAYFMFLKKPGPPPAPQAGEMVQLDAQTLTLANGHFLKVQVAVQLVEGKAAAATFETVKAAQDIIDTFSNRQVDELTTNAARKDLTDQLLKTVQKDYPDEVFAVFLTQFVIQ